jgi:hypothetical protein
LKPIALYLLETETVIMRKLHFFLASAILCSLYSTAQTTDSTITTTTTTPATTTTQTTTVATPARVRAAATGTTAHAVYAEAGGPGLLSINYDMRFTPTQDGLGFRAGFGGWSIGDSKLIFIPIGLNWITTKNGTDYFEAGAGGTIVSNSNKEPGDGPFKNSFGFLSLGYRKQPAQGGFFWKASLVPVVGKGFFWPYWVGFGAGYTF